MEIITSAKPEELLLCEQPYQKKSIPVKAFLPSLPFIMSSALN